MTEDLDKWLAELEEMEKGATEGPWRCDPVDHTVIRPVRVGIFTPGDLPVEAPWNHKADSEFVAASRSAIPKLIAIVKEMTMMLRVIRREPCCEPLAATGLSKANEIAKEE